MTNQLFRIHDLNYRPQNDFRFAIVSTDNLEFGPIPCTKQGRNSGFLQGCSCMILQNCPADVKLDLAICDVNNQLFGILDLNYRPQNDFRFAIVSADNLEFGPILCTK